MFKGLKKRIADGKEGVTPGRQSSLEPRLEKVGKAQAQNNGLLDHSPGAQDSSFDDPLQPSQALNTSTSDLSHATPQAASTPAVLPVTPQRTQRRLSNSSNFSALGDERSDVESDIDHTPRPDNSNKDDIYQVYKKQERTLQRYKSKFSELVDAYKGLQKDKEKLEGALTAGQDKQLRRINELKETIDLEQNAKRHLEETLRMSLDEKDEVINVLQTQGDISMDSSTTGMTPVHGALTEKVSNMEGVIQKQQDEISKLKFQSKDARDVILRLEQEKKIAVQDMMTSASEIADAKDSLEKEVVILRRELDAKAKEMMQLNSNHESEIKSVVEDVRKQVMADDSLRKGREAEILFKQKEEEMKAVLANKIGDFQRVIEDKERQKNDAVKYKDDVIKQLETKLAKQEKKCQEQIAQKQEMESSLDKLQADKTELLALVQSKDEDMSKSSKEIEDNAAKRDTDVKAVQMEAQQQLTKIKRASQKKIVELQEVIKSNETFLKEMQDKHTKELEEKAKEFENTKQADGARTKKIVKDLRGKLQEKDVLLEKLKSDVETLSMQTKTDSSDKGGLELLIGNLQADVTSKDSENAELTARLTQMEQEYTNSVQELLAKHNSLVASHRVELDGLQKSCHDNEKLLEESKGSFETVVESLSIATSKVDDLEKLLRDAKEDVEEKDAICKTLTDDLEVAHNQTEQLKLQRDVDVKYAKEGMETGMQRLQEELASVKRMYAAEEELKVKMTAQYDAKLLDLQQEVCASKTRLSEEQSSKSSSDATVASLQKQHQEETAKHDTVTAELQAAVKRLENELKNSNETSANTDSAWKQKLSGLEEQISELLKQREASNEDLDRSRAELSSVSMALQSSQESLQQLQDGMQLSVREKDEEIAELTRVVDDWRARSEEQEALYVEKVRAVEEQRKEQMMLMEKECNGRLTEKEDDLRQRMNEFMKEKDMSIENVGAQFEKMRKEEISDLEERHEKRYAVLQEEWAAKLVAVQSDSSAKVDALQKEHEAATTQLKESMTEFAKQKNDALKNTTAKFNAVQAESARHAQEKEGLENGCMQLEERMREMAKDHETKVSEIIDSHHQELAMLKQKREDEIGELCSKHEQDLFHWKKTLDASRVEKEAEISGMAQEHTQACNQLRDEISSLSDKIVSLEQAADVKEAEFKVSLTKELEVVAATYRAQLEQAETTKMAHEASHTEQLKQAAEKWQEKMKALQTKYKKIVEDKSSKSGVLLEKLKEDHDVVLAKARDDLNNEKEAHAATAMRLEEELKVKMDELATTKQIIEESMAENNKQLADVSAQVTALLSEKQELCNLHENERQITLGEIRMLKEKEEQLQLQSAGLESGRSDADQQVEAMRTEIKTLAEQCNTLKDALQGQNEQHEVKIASLEEAAASELSVVKGQLDAIMQAREDKEREYDAKMTEMSEQAKKKLLDMKKKAENKISNLKQQHASALESKEANISELSSSLIELKSSMSSVSVSTQEEMEQLRQQSEMQRQLNETRTEEVQGRLDALLAEKEVTITNLKTEIASLNERMESMLLQKVDALKMLQGNMQDDHGIEVKRIEAEFQEKLEMTERKLSAKVEEKEFEYSSRVKQIVKEFQQKLNEKDQEIQDATEHAIDSSQKEERKLMEEYNEQIIEYRRELKMREDDMKALQRTTEEQLTLMRETVDARQEEHKQQFDALEQDYHTRLSDITKRHETEIASMTDEDKERAREAEQRRQEEVNEIEKTYAAQIEALKSEHHNDKTAMEKKLKTQMKKNQLEMKKLLVEKGKGLHPGKLMEDATDQASPGASNPNSDSESEQADVAVLKMQLASMAKDLSALRDRENQLQQSFQQSSRPATLDVSATEHNNSYSGFPSDISQSPEPTQFEYMKKILFEYMMGRQKTQMAKVLTAIVQFSPMQTRQVLEKIQQSDSAVGLFG